MKECKHGVILYGSKCINCEREKRKQAEDETKHEAAKKKVIDNAKKLDW